MRARFNGSKVQQFNVQRTAHHTFSSRMIQSRRATFQNMLVRPSVCGTVEAPRTEDGDQFFTNLFDLLRFDLRAIVIFQWQIDLILFHAAREDLGKRTRLAGSFEQGQHAIIGKVRIKNFARFVRGNELLRCYLAVDRRRRDELCRDQRLAWLAENIPAGVYFFGRPHRYRGPIWSEGDDR